MSNEQKPGEEKSLIIRKLADAGLVNIGQRPALEGLENITQSDIATPIYMFVQPTSGASDQAGKFLDKGTGIVQDSIQCVLLKFLKTRNLWPKPYNPGDSRLCWSKNSFLPSEEIATPQSKMCAMIENGREIAACPKAEWGPKGEAPDCKITYTLLGYDLQMNTPFLISFKGKSIKPLKQLLNQFLRKQKNSWQAIITISAAKPEELGQDKGNYYIAKFKIDWAETEEELKSLRSIYSAFLSKQKEAEVAKEEHTDTSPDQETPF